MQQFLKFYYLLFYVQLNMFWASLRPSSGAQQLRQQPLILPFGAWW
jgi:hypothetical protein